MEEAQAEIRAKAEVKLHMPPVMEEREVVSRVLEEDPDLVGFDTCNYVFTDITFGVSDRSRVVVVRQPDGKLRTANWEEQDRLNQIYFPTEGRKHYTPQMFEPDNLQEILGPEKYEYILDRWNRLSTRQHFLTRFITEIVSSLSQTTQCISGPVSLYINTSVNTNISTLCTLQGNCKVSISKL